MALLTNSNLQNRPFTLERPLLRNRRAKLTHCSARSDLESRKSRSGLVGGTGLAAYIASLSKSLAEADIDVPPQLIPSGPGPQLPDVNIQLPAEAGGIGQFISDYPLALPLAAALVLVPLIVSQVSGNSGAQGVSAARALSILETEDPVVFVDIRSGADSKSQGSPDLSSIKKAAIRLPFTKAVKDEVVYDDAFLKKFSKLRQITEGVTVVLLDSSGREGAQAAKGIGSLVGKVYYVQGGAQSWQTSGLPWKAPTKFNFNLKDLGSNIDSLAEDFKAQPTTNKAIIGVGAILGGALLFVSEIDTVLEVAGLFAAGNFALRNLLFADDRMRTKGDLKTLVDDKIGAKDIPKDLQRLATTVLETEQEAEKKVGQKVGQKVEQVIPQAKSAGQDLQKAAESTVSDVQKAADSASKEAGQTINAAQDTVDLNGTAIESPDKKAAATNT